MLTHNELKAKALSDPHVRAEYDALEAEFALFAALLHARNRAGLTQTAVAEHMGTTTSAVARLEAGGGSKKHSPSIATLRKYAEAVGCTLAITFVPWQQPSLAEVAAPLRNSQACAGGNREDQHEGTSVPSSAGLPRPNKRVQRTVGGARGEVPVQASSSAPHRR